MLLKQVEIKNFRLLENIIGENSVEISENITILVGKNNSGKTSFSSLFNIFLNNQPFTFDDFSISCCSQYEKIYNEYCEAKKDEKHFEDFMKEVITKIPSIQLILTLIYDDEDDWNSIRPLFTTLDETNTLKIVFEYSVDNAKLFLEDLSGTYLRRTANQTLIDCIRKVLPKHFNKKAYPFSATEQIEKVRPSDISKIISCCFISAQRSVDDGDSTTSSKLSSIFQSEYKSREEKSGNPSEEELMELKDALDTANNNVDVKLSQFFYEFSTSFSTFGYPNVEGADIVLKSNITPTNLFKGIQLFYKNNENLFPEKYNGLGYSNLIFIISQIISFKSKLMENVTGLNLIFIEEPEAHMHPQLQNTFINKLNEFLVSNNITAQVILTTHSSHIISNGQFEFIRYFCRDKDCTNVKDLMKFKSTESQPDDISVLSFLKQYITLVKCDMFFADKIILIEGSSERLLMPLFIEKVDSELRVKRLKLLSEQYISIIEIGGAYMSKFKEFLEFLQIKTLVITDIDCSRICQEVKDGKQQFYKNGNPKMKSEKYEVCVTELKDLVTTNEALRKWIPKEERIEALVNKKMDELSIEMIAITYQRNVNDLPRLKCGRSFEEAFIIDNCKFILDNKNKLNCIKDFIDDYETEKDIYDNSYEIYSYIDRLKKKMDFVFDIMYSAEKNWTVPTYIKEGLLWLAQ
jgi:predicted ATP-dependent endonuclease of OLD family